jgi:hypothetical protein
VYASEDPADQRDLRLVLWDDFDTEDEATDHALKAFHAFRLSAKDIEKDRDLEPREAYLGYPCTTPDGICQWAEECRLPFFHKVELQSGEES